MCYALQPLTPFNECPHHKTTGEKDHAVLENVSVLGFRLQASSYVSTPYSSQISHDDRLLYYTMVKSCLYYTDSFLATALEAIGIHV